MCQSACFQKRGSLLFGILISCVFGCPKVQHMEKALQMAVSMIPNLVMLTWLGLMIHSTFWSTSTAVYIDYYRPMAKIRRTWDLENPVQLQEFIQFNSITTITPSRSCILNSGYELGEREKNLVLAFQAWNHHLLLSTLINIAWRLCCRIARSIYMLYVIRK